MMPRPFLPISTNYLFPFPIIILLLCIVPTVQLQLQNHDLNSDGQSDFNRVRFMHFDIQDYNETLEWPLDLQEIAQFAFQEKTVIKFEINTTLPVTFQLKMCGDMILMNKSMPSKKTILYLDGPWLTYFNDSSKNCREDPQDITLYVHFDNTKFTNGSIAIAQYPFFTPEEDRGNQTTSILLNVTGTRTHMISMKDYFKEHEDSNSTLNATILFHTNAPVSIPYSIGKCGLDEFQYEALPVEASNFNTSYQQRLIEYTHVYCPEKPFKYMIELTTTTPLDKTLPAGSAFLITVIPHNAPSIMMLVCVTIFIIFSVIVIIIILVILAYFRFC